MDLAEKTPCVVFESPPKPAHSIDALLLFADHAITHSSLRKILAVQPLSEGQKTARSSHTQGWYAHWYSPFYLESMVFNSGCFWSRNALAQSKTCLVLAPCTIGLSSSVIAPIGCRVLLHNDVSRRVEIRQRSTKQRHGACHESCFLFFRVRPCGHADFKMCR